MQSVELIIPAHHREKRIVQIILLFLLLLFIVLSWKSTGTHGGQDDYVHYRIARYAFKYPKLFLDHWGKPVFTILASPFAQFGYFGVRLFNLLCGLFTAWLLYVIGRGRGFACSILAPILLFFAPIYSVMLLTGMTEILFGLLTLIAIHLFDKKRYILFAMILSLLPIARTEGIVLLPWYGLALLIQRQWKAVPFMGTGFLLFSLIGYLFHYHDFLWLIHQMPYNEAEIYGRGDLLHFVKQSHLIIGYLLLGLSLLGVMALFTDLCKDDQWLRQKAVMDSVLILAPAMSFYGAHSYAWWQGIGGSIGLIRVMACVVPLWIFLSLTGIERLYRYLSSSYKKIALVIVVVALVVIEPFLAYRIPVQSGRPERVAKRTVDWLKNEGLVERYIVFYDPYIAFLIGKDPFDLSQMRERLPDRVQPSRGIPTGAIVVWDAHFGPNEGGMPIEKLARNPEFRRLRVFRPKEPFKTLNNYDYRIVVFERR